MVYHVYKTDGTMEEVHNPADLPDPMEIDRVEEPRIKANILVPDEFTRRRHEAVRGPPRHPEQELTYVGSRSRAWSSTICR